MAALWRHLDDARNTAILAVRQAGFQPGCFFQNDRQDARRPHRLEACVPTVPASFPAVRL